jgi:hypothetical protein
VIVVDTGIAVVAISALPVVGNATSLGRNFLEAPSSGSPRASRLTGSPRR